MRPRPTRPQRGFTLIEMLVVVAIIAVLCALVISASSRPVGANARNLSEQVISVINFAKLRAQSTRRVHKVTFDQTHIWVQVAADTGIVPPGTTTYSPVQTTTFPNGVHIYDIANAVYPSAGNSVTDNPGLTYDLFVRPDGQCTGSTLFIGDGAHQFRVVVYHISGGTYAREFW